MFGKIKQLFGITSILAVLMLFFSCDPTANNPTLTSHNVKVYLTEDQAVTLQVEDGNTLASLATFETPSMEGYSFVSLVTKDGTAVGLNDPITSDMTLYVKFRNSVTDNNEGKTTVTVYCTDGTKTVTSTSTTKEDKTTTTTSETTVTKEEQTVSETTEETKITTNDDGSVTTQTTTTVTDADGNTTSEKVTEVESGDGTTTTTTTEKTDAEGNTTTEKVTEVTNQDGSITTTTETTDADGNTTTQTTTDNSSAHYWVMKGINTLLGIQNYVTDIATAKVYFEKAYEVDPNDDEAKVYSSLCNLVDVATSEKIGDFVKEHLGLANYPKDFETLLKGEWLNEDVYIDSTRYFSCSKYIPVELTQEEIENGLENFDYDNWCLKANVSSEGKWQAKYYFIDNNSCLSGDEYLRYKNRLSIPKEERTNVLISPFDIIDNPSYNAEYCVLDESGSCFVRHSDVINGVNSMSEDEMSELITYLESAKIYELKSTDEIFEYKVDLYTKAPKFNTTFSNNWYKLSVEQPENLTLIFLANLLEGNTNGLSDAHDDLYSAIFEGDDYKAFVSKIESVNSSITIPRNVAKTIGLTYLFGDSNITLGKAELKLLESVLNVYKAVMEYMQAYSFNTDLSILKTDWTTTFGDALSAMNFCVESFKNYDAKIDPIANGFLTVRNADKITASKNTLISVIDDAYAAYNSIISVDSSYPTAITSFLDSNEAHVVCDGVLQLKQALENGGKLYLPEQFFASSSEQSFQFPTEWPTDGNYWIDIGKIFTAGTFSLENLIELDSNNRPVLYKLKSSGGSAGYKYEVLGKIETAEDMMAWMKNENTSSSNGSEWSYENYGVGINFKGQEILLNISSLLSEDQVNNMVKYPFMPTTVGMFFYQFYYGGLDEYFDKLVQSSGNTTQGE